MNRRLLIILLCAFLVAAGASYLVYRVAGNQIRAATAQKPTNKVVVATRDLEIGTLIRDSDLKMGDWTGPLPKGATAKIETVAGRGVISTLYEGEPVIESRLAPTGSGAGLAATIKQGLRACAVKVDEVVGLAGFVVPGMRVDVLVSGVAPNAPPTEGQRVKTILQNIEVLSAGTNIQKDAEGKPVQVQVVNLLVAPDQAELLSLASNQRIQLVLRNPLDTQIATPPAIAMASLFADPNAVPPVKAHTAVADARLPAPHVDKPAAPEGFLIEVLNGSKRTQEKFTPAEETK
jgi:pilus assembly protein CpaB